MNSVFENPYVSGEKSILSKLIEKHFPDHCTSKQGHDWRAINQNSVVGGGTLERCMGCGKTKTS